MRLIFTQDSETLAAQNFMHALENMKRKILKNRLKSTKD